MTNDFDRLKFLLMGLAKSKGITEQDLNGYDEEKEDSNWKISWNRNLDDWVELRIRRIRNSLNLYESAIEKNDLMAAKVALMYVRIASHDMMNFFDDMRSDLIKISSDSRFDWPELPQDYKVPDHYGFSY